MIRKVKRPSGLDRLDDGQWANVVEEVEMAVEDTSMILWVGSADGRNAMSWPEFRNRFTDTDYRLTGGWNVLARDLVVVLSSGCWYEQDPDSGSWYERWPPMLQPGYKGFANVTTGQAHTQGACSLEELNEDDD